ncbi:MAG: type I-C CRISPR-associated protein Cas8c/Csd1 [Thermodesulfovibrionales bacterium]
MILQALTSYYGRISEEDGSAIAPEGFEKKEIPFVIVLDREGNFKGIDDTRSGEGKKGNARKFLVPKAVKKSANIAANLLWGNPEYVLGKPRPGTEGDHRKVEKVRERHMSFIEKLEAFDVVDAGVSAVLRFLNNGDFSGVLSHPAWPEMEKGGRDISFRLEGDDALVSQRDAVRKAVASSDLKEEDDKLYQCLISGYMESPARLHSPIKGVWGAQPSGANIVSFNLPAFQSFGKTRGFNAPVGKKAEHAYTTALNKLLARDSRQRIRIGDSSTVFWTEKPNKMEDWFKDFFGEPARGESEQDNEALRALYRAPETGAPPLDNDLTRFYVLGLSPNASRIAVRFWYDGTVGEVAKNIKQHFQDCAIVHGPKEREHLSLFRLLVSTALQGKADNIQPNLAGEVVKSILTGTPYPQTMLSSAVRRTRAERDITYPRASLIKACLVRDSRYYKKRGKEVSMALDQGNANVGYRLGRLFSTLEKIQEEANPGINSTIRDRFYGAASSTPVTVFPHLMKLKNHHLAKLENRGRAVNLERLVGEIMGGVDDFPAHLSLPDQGRFAVGYYHQRQDFFTKKTTGKEE